MADDDLHEEPMPADATRSLLLWASGFGAGAVIVLLGGVLLVGLGVLGRSSDTSHTPLAQSTATTPAQPNSQSSAAPAGASGTQTTGQSPPQQSAPQQH